MNEDTNRTTNRMAEATSNVASFMEKRVPAVLQVLPALGRGGGVERGTIEVAGAIIEAGGRALVASAGGPMVHDLTRLGAEHILLPMASKNPLVMYANIGRLAGLIRRENVDIVHARSRAPAWSAYFAARRVQRPFITTFHGTYGEAHSLKRRYNAIMARGDRVIAISRFIGERLKKLYGVPPDRIRIIHRGVDLSRFDPALVSSGRIIKLARAWRLTENHPVIMLPGRLTRWKGQAVFLDALASLGRKDIRAILVGSDQGRAGYRHELESQIKQGGLEEVVRIVGHCDDMPAAYMLADVVVSTSTNPEAFGRVIAEAQALGRPVIASDHGGAQEQIIKGQTGWLTKPGDSVDLAEAMAFVLALQDDQRESLVLKAMKAVGENFSKTAMCAKTLEVYDEALHLRARP